MKSEPTSPKMLKNALKMLCLKAHLKKKSCAPTYKIASSAPAPLVRLEFRQISSLIKKMLFLEISARITNLKLLNIIYYLAFKVFELL